MKRSICQLFVATLLMFIGVTLFAKKNNSPGENKIKVLECIEVDSVPADFPVSFSFLSKDDWQFIAYYNKNRNLTVASRKTSQNKWNYKILPTKVGWDSHNRITMAFDRNYCIHVSGNMHNDTMTYFKTEKPLDISTFQKVFPLVSAEDEIRCTYPSFLKTPDGEIVFSYRLGGSGNGITITSAYNEKTKSFNRLSDKPLFDGVNQMSAYFRGPTLGPDDFYHLTWVWRNTPACETNHDLSYAKSKDLVTWETINGTKLDLPINPHLSQFTVDPVPPGGGVINGAFKLFFDPTNYPLLAYMKYDEKGNNQIYVAKPEKGSWKMKQVSDWNYRWQFEGPGSITFEIRIKGVQVNDENQISIRYWHIKRGEGELIIDAKTLLPLEDRKVEEVKKPAYPEELMHPQTEEMTVHWLKAHTQNKNTNGTYVLRWETMGKRRFYKPPENPVKPSALKLYLFSNSQ